MRKLTIDDIWRYTKRMWKWVAFQKEVLKDKRNVCDLKVVWLKENAPEFVGELQEDCFFCDVGEGGCCDCTACPGVVVDPAFTCVGYNNPHHYDSHPGAFYREILRLDAIRTAVPVVVEPPVVEHEWVHGDVFHTSWGSIMIYIELKEKPLVYCIRANHFGYAPPDVAAPNLGIVIEGATFLFNIKDALSDRGIV